MAKRARFLLIFYHYLVIWQEYCTFARQFKPIFKKEFIHEQNDYYSGR